MKKMQAFARKPIAVIVMLALLGVSAHAASIVFFTSRDEFQAATGVPRLRYNFNSLSNGSTGQIDLDGLQIQGDLRIDGGALNYGPVSLTARPGPLSFNFAGEVFAFGLEVSPTAAGGGAFNVDINGLTAGITFDGPGYVSFATDFPFRAFNLTFGPAGRDTASVSFLIDNVVANTIPEPGTLMLLAAGAGVAALYTRRRRLDEPADDGRPEDGTPGPM